MASPAFKIGGGGERHGKGPKSSPTLAEGRLFTLSITGKLTAWNAETGRQLWQRDGSDRFKNTHPYWGASTSPIVDGPRVILHQGSDGQGALVALDASTGNQIWSHGKDGPSYSSPLLAEMQGVRQVIDWNERVLVGVDSKTGQRLWEYDAPQDRTEQNMPTPIFFDGYIFLGAENRGMKCLKAERKDGKWTVRERWFQKKVALDMSTAVVNKGLLFGMSHYGRGRYFCLDTNSGKVLWQSPGRLGENVTFLSVPGHIVALVTDGQLQVIKGTGTQFERLANYRVAKGGTWAPPVLLPDGILVKGHDTLTRWSFSEARSTGP